LAAVGGDGEVPVAGRIAVDPTGATISWDDRVDSARGGGKLWLSRISSILGDPLGVRRRGRL
jgi:hypothetical protein